MTAPHPVIDRGPSWARQAADCNRAVRLIARQCLRQWRDGLWLERVPVADLPADFGPITFYRAPDGRVYPVRG